MPESRLRQILIKFIEELSEDVVEERVINYIIREIHLGRRLSAILEDSYVKNRLDEERLAHVLEKKEVVEAVEEELNQAFKEKDFKFAE